MNYREALDLATKAVLQLRDHTMDILTVKRPRDLQEASDLSKVVSKLSPLVGNTIEYTITQHLNSQKIWPEGCIWIRQDPDFPDTLLSGMPWPPPGLEIKAWFPFLGCFHICFLPSISRSPETSSSERPLGSGRVKKVRTRPSTETIAAKAIAPGRWTLLSR